MKLFVCWLFDRAADLGSWAEGRACEVRAMVARRLLRQKIKKNDALKRRLREAKRDGAS